MLSLALGVAVAFVWEYIECDPVEGKETNNEFFPQQQSVNINCPVGATR